MLQDITLLRTQAYINGGWIDADNGASYPITNPANGETIATVPALGADETRRAIAAAAAAWPAWRSKLASERAAIMMRWFHLLRENLEDLAVLLTTEIC